jgi:tripartite-type tricarboxylate transporter receptor subunit TctC
MRVRFSAFAVLFFSTLEVAAAQTYPNRPLTLVVPFAAGGPVDSIARVLADAIRQPLGQPVLIENVAGAAGTIGVGRVARSAPDGYTLSIGNWGTHVVNNAIYKLPFDTLRDFEPIGMLSASSELIIVSKSVPSNDLRGFIKWLKEKDGQSLMATSGNGSSGHIAGLLFQKQTGTRFEFVPYRGLAPALQGVLAGQADMIIDMPSNSLPHVHAGAVKALAVMDKQRLTSAPNIPTVDEAGLPGFYASIWYGLWAPKGTPKSVVEKLNGAVRQALSDRKVGALFSKLDQTIVPEAQQTPESLAVFHQEEMRKWGPVIGEAKIAIQ